MKCDKIYQANGVTEGSQVAEIALKKYYQDKEGKVYAGKKPEGVEVESRAEIGLVLALPANLVNTGDTIRDLACAHSYKRTSIGIMAAALWTSRAVLALKMTLRILSSFMGRGSSRQSSAVRSTGVTGVICLLSTKAGRVVSSVANISRKSSPSRGIVCLLFYCSVLNGPTRRWIISRGPEKRLVAEDSLYVISGDG